MVNKPSTLFAGTTGPAGDRPGPNRILSRIGMYILMAIFFPVAVITYAVWLTLFTYARLPWWIPAPVAGGFTLLGLLTGQISPHGFDSFIRSWSKMFSSIGESSIFSIVWHLFLSQAILSIWAATSWAFLVLAWKWQRAPKWQEHDLIPGPVLNKRLKVNQLAIQGGYDSPVDSLTLGIAKDLRDPRFAGGKPGTPYGERVTISDQEGAGHALVVGGSGSGKALDIETLIPTPNGFVKMGDLKVGNLVFGSDGQRVKVIGAYDIVEGHDCFEVEFSDGSKITADAEHLWAIRESILDESPVPGKNIYLRILKNIKDRVEDKQNIRGKPKFSDSILRVFYTSVLQKINVSEDNPEDNDRELILTTREILGLVKGYDGSDKYYIKLAGAVEYATKKNLVLDPYLLGLCIGDGGNERNIYNTPSKFVNAWSSCGFTLTKPGNGEPGYDIHELEPVLKSLNILTKRHIPKKYLIADETQRRALLAGLLDSFGCNEGKGRIYFCSQTKELANEFFDLVASLGYSPVMINGLAVYFQALDDVFRLQQKNDSHREGRINEIASKYNRRYIKVIRQVASIPVRCIAVDAPDKLFLAGKTFISTHNTSTMLVGMRDVIRLGRGLIVIDCKGGPDVPLEIANWCQRNDREFLHWSIHDSKVPYPGPADGPAFYDPISRGDPSRRKDLLIGSQRWDVEFYKNVVANYLQTAFAVMDLVPALNNVDTFADLADLLSPSQLLKRAKYIVAEENIELAAALTRVPEMEQQALSGIRAMYDRIQTLTSSTAGAWLRKDPEGLRDINLRKVADEGQVVVFSLDSSNYEDTVNLIAGLIIQDLKTLSSELRKEPADTPLHIYIDEFSSIDTTNLLGLLAKARDARMPVTLATQALADLQRRESTFVDQVLGIVTSFIIHRANTETDARIYAGLSGVVRKRFERIGVEQSSSILGTLGATSATGTGYSEERDDYSVAVGAFQQLPLGSCVYITKSPTVSYVNPVQVIQENENLAIFKADGPMEVERLHHEYKEYVAPRTYPHPTTVELLKFDTPVTEVDSNSGEEGKSNGPKRPVARKSAIPGKAAGSPIPLPVLTPDSTLSKPAIMPMLTPEIMPLRNLGLETGSKANDEWMMP